MPWKHCFALVQIYISEPIPLFFRKSTGTSDFKVFWTPPWTARCTTQCGTGWCWRRPRHRCGREGWRAYRWRTAMKKTESIWLPMLFPIHLSSHHTMHVIATLSTHLFHILFVSIPARSSVPHKGLDKKKSHQAINNKLDLIAIVRMKLKIKILKKNVGVVRWTIEMSKFHPSMFEQYGVPFLYVE